MEAGRSRGRFSLSRFVRSQSGSATIEAVLWMPILILFFGLIADTSAVLGRQQQILRIIQTANRELAVGQFTTTSAAQSYIETEVKGFTANFQVNVAIVNGIITSTVVVPAANLTLTGLFEGFSSLNLTMAASQMLEV